MVVSQDQEAPLAVIVGITGNQGGGVANGLIESTKPYRIVGLTRDPTKPTAQAFGKKGVNLYQVDLAIGNEVAVTKAFDSADIVFAVTDYRTNGSAHQEALQGKMLVDCAKAAGAKMFIWSSGTAISKISGGEFSVGSFDGKAEVAEHLKASGLPYKLIYPSGFLSTFLSGPLAPKKQDDGTYVLRLTMPPTTVRPMVDMKHDFGMYVRTLIENPVLGLGSEIWAGTAVSYEDLMKELSELTGRTYIYRQISREEWDVIVAPLKAIPTERPLGDMYYDMGLFVEKYGYFGGKDIAESHKAAGIIAPTFREMYLKNKEAFAQ